CPVGGLPWISAGILLTAAGSLAMARPGGGLSSASLQALGSVLSRSGLQVPLNLVSFPTLRSWLSAFSPRAHFLEILSRVFSSAGMAGSGERSGPLPISMTLWQEHFSSSSSSTQAGSLGRSHFPHSSSS